MIIIAGTIDLDPAKRDAALEAGSPHLERTRAQKGCLAYVFSADPVMPGRICVYELWEDEASLAAHFAGPHYLGMRDALQGVGIKAADNRKFEVSRVEPVYDETGKPRADFFTRS